MANKEKIGLVQIDDTWAFKIDQYNNHMWYELKEVVKDKGKSTETKEYQWRHDGNYYKNYEHLFNALFIKLRNREFSEDESPKVPMEEFFIRLEGILQELNTLHSKFKKIIGG